MKQFIIALLVFILVFIIAATSYHVFSKQNVVVINNEIRNYQVKIDSLYKVIDSLKSENINIVHLNDSIKETIKVQISQSQLNSIKYESKKKVLDDMSNDGVYTFFHQFLLSNYEE